MAPPAVTPATPNNPQPAPVNRYSARSSYHGPSGFHPSEGLKRARRPFRFRNAVTGLGIMAFVTSVYSYSISAVKQDDFSDLPEISTMSDKEGVKTIEEELAEKRQSVAGGNRGIGAMMGFGSSPQGEGMKINNDVGDPSQRRIVGDGRFPSGPSQTLNTPLPPNSTAAADVAAGSRILPASATESASSRQKSSWIVGAPDVDRFGKLNDRRTEEATIQGRRQV